jgi:CheY-like chemotaxis protein
MRRHQQPEPAADALAGMRVLLVEDHAALRRILAQSLEDLGATVTAVADAAAALAAVEAAGQPDLLLSDIRLPGAMNGVVLADALRARFPRLIVVLQTGYASTDPGHHHVLAKPFDVPDLVAVITAARARDAG